MNIPRKEFWMKVNSEGVAPETGGDAPEDYALLEVEDMRIPDSITEIYDGTFANRMTLASVVIPGNVKAIGSTKNDFSNQSGAFQACTSLKSVVIDEGVLSIGTEAFRDCTSLEYVAISNSVTQIGRAAFASCKSLEVISIPESVTEIGERAFMSSGLRTVTIPKGVKEIGGWTFQDCALLESVTISSGVKEIEKGAFYGCKSLKSVSVPKTVTKIEDGVFVDCNNLTVEFDGTREQWREKSFVEKTPFSTVRCTDGVIGITGRLPAYLVLEGTVITGCDKDIIPESVVIPDGVTEIVQEAFKQCMCLESVSIPGTVAVIQEATFKGSASLKRVILYEGITEIGSEAFHDCTSLERVAIPNGVREIGQSAFAYCNSLRTVTLPRSVKKIGDEAFFACDNLTVHFDGTKEQWEAVEKVRYWNGVGVFAVRCTDGELGKQRW